MLGYLIRMIIGVVIGQLVQGVLRMLTNPKKQERTPRYTPPSPPRNNRIQINRKDIVEGKFEDISDDKT